MPVQISYLFRFRAVRQGSHPAHFHTGDKCGLSHGLQCLPSHTTSAFMCPLTRPLDRARTPEPLRTAQTPVPRPPHSWPNMCPVPHLLSRTPGCLNLCKYLFFVCEYYKVISRSFAKCYPRQFVKMLKIGRDNRRPRISVINCLPHCVCSQRQYPN